MNRPVDELSLAPHGDPAVGAAPDCSDAQVDAGRQAGVETDLVLAGAQTLVEGPEIEKAQVHGPLQLEDVAVEQEHPGDVRLDEGHRPGGRHSFEGVGPQKLVAKCHRVTGSRSNPCGSRWRP